MRSLGRSLALSIAIMAVPLVWPVVRDTLSAPPRETLHSALGARRAPKIATASYDAALSDLSKRRANAETLASDSRRISSRWAQAAHYEMTYARLTGDYEGYVSAEQSLDKAFKVAHSYIDNDAVGPLMQKAQLDYELHRLRPALDSLRHPESRAQFLNDKALLAETKSLRGAVTFSLGDYDTGVKLLRESVALGVSPSHKQRLALALEKIGALDEAMRLMDESERVVEAPQSRAWISFQRGRMCLDRGQRSEARRYLEKAEKLFPGFWLIEEHIAELDADEGHHDKAIAEYRSLVSRTNNPEFMDALARLIADRDPDESQKLIERSRAIYESRLAKLPEASYGHALEHFLKVEKDAARALDIARKNRDLRPDGEARTRLAQAYLKAGRPAEARAEIDKVLASKWSSAEAWATAALAFRRSGDDARAADAEARALAMNPHANEQLDWL